MEKVATRPLNEIMEVFAEPGNLTITGAKDVFSHIDLAFKDRKDIQVSNGKTKFFICGLGKDCSFEKAFASAKKGLALSAICDNAVVKICLEYKHLLVKQSMFFYLGDNIVARVTAYSDGLHINRYSISHPVIWKAKRNHIFVISA